MQSAMLFVSVPLSGFALGFVPIVSYNYGHGNRERVKECFKTAMTFILFYLFYLLVTWFLLVYRQPLLLMKSLIQLVAGDDGFGSNVTSGLQRACQNMFVALGQAKVSIFIALLRKVILLVPLALILPHLMGVVGVYAAEGISDATAAICCTAIFAVQFPKIMNKLAMR